MLISHGVDARAAMSRGLRRGAARQGWRGSGVGHEAVYELNQLSYKGVETLRVSRVG